jgi:threonine/homoserine/homoserine lactone efflux protein
MLENILTISISGFLAGFIFSMPVAGPISIIITSNALKGKLRFCARTAIGAVIVEFVYVMIAVYGIARFYPYYKPVVPYILLIGSIIILAIGVKIAKTRLDLKNIDTKVVVTDKIANRGGFRIGLFLNLTNPTLFIGWLVSSFMVFSFVSSLGFETGGLEKALNENVDAVSKIAGPEFKKNKQFNHEIDSSAEPEDNASVILMTIIYAFTVAVGGLAWLYGYARFIVKHRGKLNLVLLNKMIQSLGVVLILFALYLGYEGVRLM